MTREQSFFLRMIADHLQQKNSSVPDGLDWEQLAAYAKSHELEGLVYLQSRDYLKRRPELSEVLKRLETAYSASYYLYLNNLHAYDELKALYSREKAPFFMVKGLAVSALYPVPALRTMGDLDLVLHSEDRERTHEAILALGYRHTPNTVVMCYRRGAQSLEIHDHLLNDLDRPRKAEKAFFDACWDYAAEEAPGEAACRLDWNYHFVFLVSHLSKHFSGGGVGFRQFMDLAVVLERVEPDWAWIKSALSRIGLLAFAERALSFCRAWWGARIPEPLPTLDEGLYERSTDFVFKNGVFGFDNEDARVNSTEKLMRKTRLPKPLRPLAAMLRKIFVPYDYVVHLPYCSFVKGQKYLLPLAWIYRVFYVAIKKKGHIDSERKLVFASRDKIESHSDLMDQWGL